MPSTRALRINVCIGLLIGLALAFGLSPAGRAADTPPAPGFAWRPQNSGTKERFRGLSVVNDRVAWASGTNATYTRTTDAGVTWTPWRVIAAVPDGLDFRDVEAFDEWTAYLLASGPGRSSRLYRTEDAGETWILSYTNPDSTGFLDAIAFWDTKRGIIFGDPVGGKFRVFLTENGGRTWKAADPAALPPALPHEGGFAASGTCLITLKGSPHAWFATGGAGASRVFRTSDFGRSWAVAEVPILAKSASAGVFSLAFRDPLNGLAIGGDYQSPDRPGSSLARTGDGGKTWTLLDRAPAGYRSAISFAPGEDASTVLTVGPGGADVSVDGGTTWSPVSGRGYHAAVLATDRSGWAVGDAGRIQYLVPTAAAK